MSKTFAPNGGIRHRCTWLNPSGRISCFHPELRCMIWQTVCYTAEDGFCLSSKRPINFGMLEVRPLLLSDPSSTTKRGMCCTACCYQHAMCKAEGSVRSLCLPPACEILARSRAGRVINIRAQCSRPCKSYIAIWFTSLCTTP